MKNKKFIQFGHIYAIEFSDGSVKVGRTKKLSQRLAQHLTFAKKAGVRILNQVNSVLIPNYEQEEMNLIRICKESCKTQRSSEHFTGVDFSVLKGFVSSFSLLSDAEMNEAIIHNEELKKEDSLSLERGVDLMKGIDPNSRTYDFDKVLNPTFDRLKSAQRNLSRIFALHVAAHHAYGHEYDDRILMVMDSIRYLKTATDLLGLSMEGIAIESAYEDSCKKLRQIMTKEMDDQSRSEIQSAIDYVNSAKKSETGFVFPPIDCWADCPESNDDIGDEAN